MTELDDRSLLRSYVQDHSETALAEIVRRHLALVYHAALRQTGGRQALAEEISQSVFTDLARKAPLLLDRSVLAGWLHTSTRFAAGKALRAEARRRAREQAAFAMQDSDVQNHETAAHWERLRPVIDEALHALEETDREAVLLRFFEGRAFAEIGARLLLTEEAARKRVERALEKMARALSQRGIASTSAALSIALAQLSAAPAPASLGSTVIAAALHATATRVLPVAASLTLMLLLVGGVVTWEFTFGRRSESSLQCIRSSNASLLARLPAVEQAADELHRQAEAAQADHQRLQAAIAAASLAGAVDEEASRAVFVIDTSGSMRNPQGGKLFAAVFAQLDQILQTKPHLRLFQLLDGDGRGIVAGTAGTWLRNEPAVRQVAQEALRAYVQDSVSNPVPGVQAALQALDASGAPLARMHVFVLGDELNSPDHSDLVLAQLDELNPANAQGRRRVAISAIGFPTWQPIPRAAPNVPPGRQGATTARASPAPPAPDFPPRTFVRFHRLMTELAARHGGTFTLAGDLGNEP